MKLQKRIAIIFILALTILFIGCNKKITTIEQKIDPKTQQILENNTFLNSTDGMKYQKSAWYFAKAFFNGDMDYIKKNLSDSSQLEDYGYKKLFSKIDFITYRIFEYDSKTKTVYGEYIFAVDKNDGFRYLDFEMNLDDSGEWKIKSYSVDA